MTALRRTAAEAGRTIADALGAAGIPYALGGALALAVAGVPRGTRDVDVNVFVALDALGGAHARRGRRRWLARLLPRARGHRRVQAAVLSGEGRR